MPSKKHRFDGKVINIAGIDYKVKYVKSLGGSKNSGLETAARVDLRRRIIYLLNNLSPSEEIAYLIHEICHAVLEVLLPPTLNEDLEELFVGLFARILTGALMSAGVLVTSRN